MRKDRSSAHESRQKMIDRLARPIMIDCLSIAGRRTVLAFRILSICSQAGCDPLAELARRFQSVTAAKAFMGFAETSGQSWPDVITVYRPCACLLSPDEWTLAQLVGFAAEGDRVGFERLLGGFVRPARLSPLFAAATLAAAEAMLIG